MDNQQPDIDFTPVVKLFTPDSQCTWQYSSLAGLFGYPYPRPAPASQARGPDSPHGLRPLLHPCSKSELLYVLHSATAAPAQSRFHARCYLRMIP